MNTSLSIINKYKSILSSYRFIIVQHLMRDTYLFINHLISNDIEVCSLVFKGYSVNYSYISKLRSLNIRVVSGDCSANMLYNSVLNEAVERTIIDGKKIVILDLGGSFSEIDDNYDKYIQCIVEDTHFGHWRYMNKLKSYPIYSVAESKLKEIEAVAVGNSVSVAIYEALLSYGNSLTGMKTLVVGYGMIGSNIAYSLKGFGTSIYVNDVHQHKMLKSVFKGNEVVHDFRNAVNQFDLIIGATGNQSISKDVLATLKNGGFVCSASSGNIEIDLDYIISNSTEKRKINSILTSYLLEGKKIVVLNNGFPINFTIPSVPDEIIDLLFSEMLSCVVDSTDDNNNKTDSIRSTSESMIDYIASLWIKGTSNEN